MVAVVAALVLLLVAEVARSSPVYKYVSAAPYKYAYPPPPPLHAHHAHVHAHHAHVPYKYEPYKYAYPPPPPLHAHHAHVHAHTHKHPRPPHELKAMVTGHVYCDTCKDGKFQEPLKGVTIGVICWNGKVEQSFYGITNKLGNFKVKLSGYDYHKHGGAKSCRVKLISPSYATSCILPTDFHGGKLGARPRAHPHIKSKTPNELVLLAGPFAYTSPFKNKKCYHNGGTSPSPHKHSHLHAKHTGPSCPAYDCKDKSSPSYKHESSPLISNKHTYSPAFQGKYEVQSPHSHSFKYSPPSIYFQYKKIPKSHKFTHSPPFPLY